MECWQSLINSIVKACQHYKKRWNKRWNLIIDALTWQNDLFSQMV